GTKTQHAEDDDGPEQQRPQGDSDESLRDETIEKDVVRAIEDVARVPPFSRGRQLPRERRGQRLENDELRLRPVPDDAPPSRRDPRDHGSPVQLSAPAGEDPVPELKATPSRRPLLDIRDLAETSQQPHFPESSDRRPGHVEQDQEC